jgi:hypothetical protein
MASDVGSAGAVNAIVRDVQTWSVLSERQGYAFDGYAVSTGDGTVLIDPPDPVRTAVSPSTCSNRSPVCCLATATTAGRRRVSAGATP